MSLLSFLIDHPVDNLTREVTVSERLKDHPFTIRAMTGADFAEHTRRATRAGKGRGAEFDARAFDEAVVLGHTVEPDFRDAQALRTAGCATPEQFLNRSLLAGEIAALAARISELSGFDGSLEDAVGEAKNS